jgi:hypothetical protein
LAEFRFNSVAQTSLSLKSLLIWLILVAAEILHGIARAVLLVPHVGEFRSNQIGVFTGSLTTLVFIRRFRSP